MFMRLQTIASVYFILLRECESAFKLKPLAEWLYGYLKKGYPQKGRGTR